MMKQPVRIVAQQQYPRCRLRRFLARSLDIALCSLLFTFITQILGLLNAAQGGISVAVERLCVLLVALLLANAFCLTVWGTTPGKAVFGLHLETSKGGKPSFLDVLRREWQVLLYGCGLLIPVCSQICQWISYRQCANGAVSRWDEESPLRYTVRDNKKLRYAAFAAIYAAMLVAMLCLTELDYRMPHMGRLTVAELADNYNHYLKMQSNADLPAMTAEGQWEQDDFAPVLSYQLDGEGHIRQLELSMPYASSREMTGLPLEMKKAAATVASVMVLSQEGLFPRYWTTVRIKTMFTGKNARAIDSWSKAGVSVSSFTRPDIMQVVTRIRLE